MGDGFKPLEVERFISSKWRDGNPPKASTGPFE
jgi:hypothetical protein